MGDNVGAFAMKVLIRFDDDQFVEVALGALRGGDAPPSADDFKLQYGIDLTQINEVD